MFLLSLPYPLHNPTLPFYIPCNNDIRTNILLCAAFTDDYDCCDVSRRPSMRGSAGDSKGVEKVGSSDSFSIAAVGSNSSSALSVPQELLTLLGTTTIIPPWTKNYSSVPIPLPLH